ncbi:cyclic nucleotide-binding domain-containing protein [Magnetofaba australis]|uniref:Putative Crp/Fnr family transcriptional regulator n=1 Tax=Magnetofaba australis IT-1 TaxID=1434232 RepID=A0A1Y2K3L9_9PROT|nr:cyclic nucleotide-binding domain-containing protein [Magnetofaba australis]OSM02226.1 putative Crp/Fnr family transcriptional regulator [Magnetofaba australis IT-1]
MRKVAFLFNELDEDDIDWIADYGGQIHVSSGELLIRHGRIMEHMYILLDGALSVQTEEGVEVAELEAGEVVGEMSFIESTPPTVNVVVKRDAWLLALATDDIRERMEMDVYFARNLYKAMAQFLSHRVRLTVEKLGYGDGGSKGGSGENWEEGLDLATVDRVHLGLGRFETFLDRMRSKEQGV